VQNFGQVASKTDKIRIIYNKDGRDVEIASGKIPFLKPYEKTTIEFTCGNIFEKGIEYNFTVLINPESKRPTKLEGKITPVK
jgi:hypothetical protein